MKHPAVTVASGFDGPIAVAVMAAVSDELGCTFEPPVQVRRTILDSFDGRAHAAGLRVELLEEGRLKLVLSRDGAIEAEQVVAERPRFARDLPPGRLRDRLVKVFDVRTFGPTLQLAAECRRGVLGNEPGKASAVVAMYERLTVVGFDSASLPAVSIEVRGVSGARKAAARARTALERLGMPSQPGDALTLAVTTLGIDQRGFRESPTVLLDPAMTAIDGFRAALANLATTINANWQGTIDQIDPEFLHDLRVALRRTRTVVRQGSQVLPAATVALAMERFGVLAKSTGSARDLDVALIDWPDLVGAQSSTARAALEPVRQLISSRRDLAMTDLAAALDSPTARGFMQDWSAWLTEPLDEQAPGVHADRALGRVVAKTIAKAHAVLVDGGRAITDETPAEVLHSLRKDAKRLRYQLECFGGLLQAGHRKTILGALKALQENLGEFQDSEVQAAGLRAIAVEIETEAPFETMVALGRLAARLDQRRAIARRDFAERFAKFDTAEMAHVFDAALDGLKASAERRVS